MRTLILLFFCCGIAATAFTQSDFITTWRTTTPNDSITIPTFPGETYDYSVNWGDGNTTSGHTGDATHIYANAGDYTVSISGSFPHISFFYSTNANRQKIISIDQWGTQQWTSMAFAFYGCSNLAGQASDAPDLSLVKKMSGMFNGATSFNQDIGLWDVGQVADMSFMFADASSFNQDIGDWDVGQVSNMIAMFLGASSFNQGIGDWNVGQVTNMRSMFLGASSFNQDIGDWDVGQVTNMYYIFSNASAFNQDIGDWNVGQVSNMSGMFHNTSSFNQDIGDWDVGRVSTMYGMFFGATSFNQNLGNWVFNGSVNLNFMLDNSGLDCDNYSASLIGWAANPATPSGRHLRADTLQYGTNAVASRDSLIDILGWTITGDTPSGMDCTGSVPVESPEKDDKPVIAPNPANTFIRVVDLPDGVLDYSITDMYGRLLSKGQCHTNEEILVKHLPKGIYQIWLDNGTQRWQERFVKY